MVYFSQKTKVGVLQKTQFPTLKFFLQIALRPVGSTMYVWGGGWNENDTGSGPEACTLGVSPRWAAFAGKQTASYDYRTTRYQIHDGLDCSGYVGWCIYNLLHTPLSNANQHSACSHPKTGDASRNCIPIENTAHASVDSSSSCGYVMPAHQMAANFAARGWGSFIPRRQIIDYRAGDIMSSRGHVWIAVGQCSDGSVVLLHSSPPGIQLCGTPCPHRSSSAGSTAPSGTGAPFAHHTPSPDSSASSGAGAPFAHHAPSPDSSTSSGTGAPLTQHTPSPDSSASSGTGAPLAHHAPSPTSQAIRLASRYMYTYYADWYLRYPDCARGSSYLSDYDQMRWDTSGNAVLTDPEGFRHMSASAVLENLFTH